MDASELSPELQCSGSVYLDEFVPNLNRLTLPELLKAIEKCKDLVLQTSPMSAARRNLVKRLVELRQRVQELKEGDWSDSSAVFTIRDHQFMIQGTSLPDRRYCECCGGLIWTIVQPWYFCRLCGYYVHAKCLQTVKRRCASALANENPTMLNDICPEKGLLAQDFCCADCGRPIAIEPAAMSDAASTEAKLCHYSGLYFCANCHWNDEMVIPARVLHNWDFAQRPVSRKSKQFLRIMFKRPLLRVEAINGSLFGHATGLFDVKKLRHQLMLMKPYLRTCRMAAKECLIARLRPYAHFIDSQDVYSVQDLIDVNAGVALPHLTTVVKSFLSHIREQCEICRGNGFICELCHDAAVLFPFDDFISRCAQCSWVYHRTCFNRNNGLCPRCQRFAGRLSAFAAIEAAELVKKTVDK